MRERFVSFLKRILKVMDFISLLSILYHYDRHEEAMQQVLIVFTPLVTPVLRITKLRFGLWQQSC